MAWKWNCCKYQEMLVLTCEIIPACPTKWHYLNGVFISSPLVWHRSSGLEMLCEMRIHATALIGATFGVRKCQAIVCPARVFGWTSFLNTLASRTLSVFSCHLLCLHINMLDLFLLLYFFMLSLFQSVQSNFLRELSSWKAQIPVTTTWQTLYKLLQSQCRSQQDWQILISKVLRRSGRR
jgi:hypothetical protein